MHLSLFFHHLRSAYQAELDDLASDSEGKHVLPKKLAERRKELGFLLSMLELSPEMVAVVFHQAFRFKRPGLMEDLVRHESEDLPAWELLAEAVDLQPWARTLAQQVLEQPNGPWFMSVAAALEYLHHKHDSAFADAGAGSEDDEDAERADSDNDAADAMDEDERAHYASEAEGAAWMVEQGFDYKD